MRRTRSLSGSRGGFGFRRPSICHTISRSVQNIGTIDDFLNVPPLSVAKVVVNGFRFPFSNLKIMHQYVLKFVYKDREGKDKELPNKNRDAVNHRRKQLIGRLFATLIADYPQDFRTNTAVLVFDRYSNLYSSEILLAGGQEKKKFQVPVGELKEGEFMFVGNRQNVEAVLSYVGVIKPFEETDDRTAETYIETALSLQQLQDPRFIVCRAKVFDLNSNFPIESFSLKNGHQKNVIRLQDSHHGLIILDPKRTLFHQQRDVDAYVIERFNLNPRADLTAFPLNDMLRSSLKGLTVVTIHRQYRHMFVISDVTAQSASSIMIENLDLSIADYFAGRYGIVLQHPDWPCVVEKQFRGNSYFPFEVLQILKDQRVFRSEITNGLEAEVIKACQMAPLVKYDHIYNESTNAGLSRNNHFLRNVGMTPEDDLLAVNSKILHPPAIEYGNTVKELTDHVWDFTNNDQYVRPAKIFHLLVLAVNIPYDTCNELGQQLRHFMSINGIIVNRMSVEACSNTDLDSMVKMILEKKTRNGVDFVLAFGDEFRFHDNLKATEIQTGVVTQHVMTKTVSGFKRNTVNNILLKLNLKGAGVNQGMGTSGFQLGNLKTNFDINKSILTGTMVFGLSTSHARIDNGQINVYGFAVTTTNNGNVTHGGYFYSHDLNVPIHSEYMKIAIDNAIQSYVDANKIFPRRIIFYRGGYVTSKTSAYNTELFNFGTRLKELVNTPEYKKFGATMPSMDFILCSRQHNIRLLRPYNTINPASNPVSQNVHPGTVVENILQKPNQFLIVPHRTLIGTARPVLAEIIAQKGLPLPRDLLVQITNNLCYMHEICTSPTALPAPLKSAEELADRGHRNYSTGDFSELSSDATENTRTAHFNEITEALGNPLLAFKKRFWA